MVENCIGTFGLPIGVATNFVVNGRALLVPMAIAEASEVAAESSGAIVTGCPWQATQRSSA